MYWRLRQLNPPAASDTTLRAVHEFLSSMARERNPEDSPRSLQYTLRNFRNFALITSEKAVPFYAWQAGKVVGEAFIVVGLEVENSHLLWGDIQVLAEHRRDGIGKALLRKVVEVAESEGRRLIMATTDSAIPAGEVFAKATGAAVGLVEVTRELRLNDVAPDLLAAWMNAAPADEYRLLTWLGAYPENAIEAMADLQEVMNTAPIGDLDYEDEQVTPKDIRESEAYEVARGFERWTMVAQHKASGELAGFTEVKWHPDNPRLLTQGTTVVAPSHRRLGLGRWLKASMLNLVMRQREQVQRIRTENAEANEAMLKINGALGYRHYKSQTEWQLGTEQAKKYLAMR